MAALLGAVILGGALFLSNSESRIVQKVQNKEKELDEGFPVKFSRPPLQVWAETKDIYFEPGMPEGCYAQLPAEDSRHALGIFGCPKVDILMNNRLYPYYRTDNLYL